MNIPEEFKKEYPCLHAGIRARLAFNAGKSNTIQDSMVHLITADTAQAIITLYEDYTTQDYTKTCLVAYNEIFKQKMHNPGRHPAFTLTYLRSIRRPLVQWEIERLNNLIDHNPPECIWRQTAEKVKKYHQKHNMM